LFFWNPKKRGIKRSTRAWKKSRQNLAAPKRFSQFFNNTFWLHHQLQ